MHPMHVFEHSFLDLIAVQWLLVYSMSGFAQSFLCQVYTRLLKFFLDAFTRPTTFLTLLLFNAADRRI
jgi:hypothetical protein